MSDKKIRREGEKVVQDLETLLQDLMGTSVKVDATPDEKIQSYMAMMARTRGRLGWGARIEKLIWRISAPLSDCRLRRQIRVVTELGQSIGWQSEATADEICRLNDLVFARTYGAMVAPQIKRAIRDLASRGVMASHELQNLVMNRCFRVDEKGCVVVQRKPWLRPIGIFVVLLIILGALRPVALVASAPFSIWASFVGFFMFAFVFAVGYWLVDRFSFTPHRLIPRAQYELRRPSLV